MVWTDGPGTHDHDLFFASTLGPNARAAQEIESSFAVRIVPRMADIYRAAESGNLQALYKWLKKGEPVDSSLKATKATPLIWAARKAHPSAVKLLIRFKATLDLQDVNGNTALHYACQNKDAKTANILIEAGASLSLANNNGQCPFQLSEFSFFKAQVLQFFEDRIAENLRRRAYIDAKSGTVDLSIGHMDGLTRDNTAQMNMLRWLESQAAHEGAACQSDFDALQHEVDNVVALKRSYEQTMLQARVDEEKARERERRLRELEKEQDRETAVKHERLLVVKKQIEKIEADIEYYDELLVSRTSILAPIETFPDDPRIAHMCLDGILSLVHADDSEEMEASMVSSGAKARIQDAVDKFGGSNPGLDRNGKELVRVLTAYEASMNAYRKE